MDPDLDFTADDLEALASLGISQDKLEAIKQKMGQAEATRFQEGPQGRSNGRVYTAANPLEHIGHGIQKYRAGRHMQQLEQQQQQELQNQANTRQSVMGRMLRGGGGQTAPGVRPPVAPRAPQGAPQMPDNQQRQMAMMLRRQGR